MLLTRSPAALSADDATATALLNCLIREVCAPEQQVRTDLSLGRAHLVVRLPRADVVLRTGLARPPAGPTFRLVPPYEERRGDGWTPVSWNRLADLVAGELELATGRANPEFLTQVDDSRAALAAILAARGENEAAARDDAPSTNDRYIASEQSLVAGHRFHPSPKSRQGAPDDWLKYAPEARARFRPHWLAVPEYLLAEEGDPDAFAMLEKHGPPPGPGRRLIPAHPWQLALLSERLHRPLHTGLLTDLGPSDTEALPTSSVRTVYLPDADVFCKFSLDVRITNCLRKNSWYELSGAVALNDLLEPVFASMGVTLLSEPAYRTVTLADRRLYEGLGVILRQGVRHLPGTPLLAGALADPYGDFLSALPALATPEGALAWWDAYVGHVAPPVLRAYLDHGIVLEPHLQNVLVCVNADGMPVHTAFRDLEGTKLVQGRWDLAHLPPRVAEAVTYAPDRGWNRVVYCLLLNHLTEIAAAVADLHPDLELWPAARRHFAAHDRHPQVRALLAGVPLPAKANLRTRWSRTADRGATYVPAPNPLAMPL